MCCALDAGSNGTLVWSLSIGGKPKYLSLGPQTLYVTLFDNTVKVLRAH